MKPAMTPQQEEFTNSSESPFQKYRRLVTGDTSLPHFLYYELSQTILSGLPGIIGLGLRGICYPPLFAQCGGRAAFGKGTLIRCPKQISLGAGLVCDDYAVLDVRGRNGRINTGKHVCIGRYSIIAAKEGTIDLGDGVNIGSHSRIATQSRVEIGASTLIAAYCYIGPGNHQQGDDDAPLISKEMEIKGGVKIGTNVWVGARATILDGVTIGDGAIIGAHSLVREDVPPNCIAVGTPARIIAKPTKAANT